MAGILEMIKSNDMLKVLLILVGVYLLVTYVNPSKKEGLEDTLFEKPASEEVVIAEKPAMAQPTVEFAEPEQVAPVKEETHLAKIVSGEKALNADDLLPKYDDANEFAKENPVSKLLKEQNFLVSGYHVGINTVMQSNKIPYHDIRSAPPIPKESVGPWNQSSYETPMGAGRRQLEIN
jgi:hypothetical protein